MRKVTFTLDGQGNNAEFYVLEKTKINGFNYLLVAESEDENSECLILKETKIGTETEEVYEIVEDDTELLAVSRVFEELLEDIEIEM